MKEETLSALFMKTKGAAIEINGRLVQPIFQMKINDARKTFLIRRVASISSPTSGLRIKVVKGEIEVNSQSHSDVILWVDSSPELVEISVLSKAGCELKMWNVWRVGDLVQAWIGNAGIVISKTEEVITLECSDGVGEIDFSNLIIELKET